MPFSCPRPCGRLATAAILISVGVVQLIAGVILLKSRYVYLLSAPDFWTAFCNLAVGGLLGLSAGVWKSTSKKSKKHMIRRNILTALVASSILMNSTTAVILILGEGNALLSIRLEKGGIDTSATLASEILAYAYAASVCSPTFGVVVAIIFLTGMCFPKRRKSLDIINVSENSPSAFNWVYKTEPRDLPKPDPEILKNALSSKSFTSSDDSSSATEFPNQFDTEHHFDTSLKRSIHAIGTQNGNFLQRINQYMEYIDNYPDTSASRHDRNRTSIVDDPSADGRHIQTLIPTGICSEPGNPYTKIKKRGDIRELKYESKNVYDTEESQNPEGIRRISHSQDAPPNVSNTSIASFRSCHIPTVMPGEMENTPPCVENFVKGLHCLEYKHLRRTSTGSDLADIAVKETFEDINSPTEESFNHSMIHKTISGKSCNTKEQNSELTLLDQTGLSIDSRGVSLSGKVVPIRVNTFPRKKLPAKMIPVSIPVVSQMKTPMNEQKEGKFESRRDGFSSFHGGCQMKNYSKSTPRPAKQSVRVFSAATTSSAVTACSDAPLEGTHLQLSPAHTSGYVSVVEDNTEPSSLDSSESNKGHTPNASPSAGNEWTEYARARKKFRAAQKKILDGGRPLSPNEIDDIVIEIINEIPLLSKVL